MASPVNRFEPWFTKQCPDFESLKSKIDENLLRLKKFSGDLTVNVNQVLETFNIGQPGGVGGGRFPLTSGDSASARHDDSGAEFLSYGWAVPFSILPPVVSLILCFYAASDAGVATYRARIGGTYRAVDGFFPPAAVAYATSSTLTVKTIAVTVNNPGVDGTVKVTQQSSGAGVDCQVDECNGSIG